MKIISAETAITYIQKYLASNVTNPFFVIVDDSIEYLKLIDALSTLLQIRVSDYCADSDAFPDIDALFNEISSLEHNSALLGFGEWVSLSDNLSFIGRLKDMSLPVKLVVICRGIRDAVLKICESDPKFGQCRRMCLLLSQDSYKIIKLPCTLKIAAFEGFKKLLCYLEEGASGPQYVKSNLTLYNTLEINSAYEIIQYKDPAFSVCQNALSQQMWAEYVADDTVYGYDMLHWRTFLQMKMQESDNSYLKYVIDTSQNYEAYKQRILNALLDFDMNDNRFPEMYTARKKLLAYCKDSDIADYIAETKVKEENRLYYLTDNTLIEQKTIIESLEGIARIPEELENLYPALHEYLHDYRFSGDMGHLLTEYFKKYKLQKLTNQIDHDFYEKVKSLAADGNRPYNKLKTRGEVIDRISKKNTALYWMDALGSEYIGYIQKRAKALGIRLNVHVVRANLPTITSFNRDFYDVWTGCKVQSKLLDDIKHEGTLNYDYEKVKTPIHLAEELQIIDAALNWIKAKLASKDVDKIILASDHGASRLAVINEKECKWEMESKGVHSGRCCPRNEADVKSEYATCENDFWVLASYDRFKGGRKTNVEVHGGASLEEVVIPLFEIELYDNKIEVNNTTPVITASYRKNAELILFSKSRLNNISIRVRENNKQYFGEKIGNNKYRFILPEIKKKNTYEADVFESDNLITQIQFKVQPESIKDNDEDWF